MNVPCRVTNLEADQRPQSPHLYQGLAAVIHYCFLGLLLIAEMATFCYPGRVAFEIPISLKVTA
jgi:hypothetical protein